MRRRVFLTTMLALFAAPAVLWAWGYRVHFTVNHGAVDLLPEPLHAFYHLNRSAILRHSVDPDLWVEMKENAPPYAPPASAHFIDLDLLDNAPFSAIPREYAQAAAKFGGERVKEAGTLPWEIARQQGELTAAFRAQRWKDVVKQSAWIAHFAADATMPLHTTKNYRGQFSGNLILDERGPNRSVHHRLEWGLPEAFPGHYDAILGDAGQVKHIDDVLAVSWATVKEPYRLIPSVLRADKEAAQADGTFGTAYYSRFDAAMFPLVKRQIARSQELAASLWLTAWEDAGRPAPPMVRVMVELPDYSPIVMREKTGTAAPVTALLAAAVVILAWCLLRARSRRGNR